MRFAVPLQKNSQEYDHGGLRANTISYAYIYRCLKCRAFVYQLVYALETRRCFTCNYSLPEWTEPSGSVELSRLGLKMLEGCRQCVIGMFNWPRVVCLLLRSNSIPP